MPRVEQMRLHFLFHRPRTLGASGRCQKFANGCAKTQSIS
jgi:hypothetical protein